MITKVTKDNKGLYRALFEKATAHLAQEHPGEEPIVITSLDDYFCSLKTLANSDMVYSVLPLDEPFFEIDANTRVIKVPNEFKTNGISVKGDQIAETLYFTIDRYYDTIDLSDDDVKIYIQWEAPNGRRGIYRAIMQDITLLQSEGKMLFGWTIDNKITSQSGTLKFSVRFVMTHGNDEGEQEINFSLSTLTANAIINPGLDFEFDGDIPAVELIDNTNIVRTRFKNSAYHDDTVVAEAPEFLINIPASADVFFTDENHEIMDEVILNFVDLKDGEYKFVASATSNDAGLITYEWYKATLNSNLTGKTALQGHDEYIKTTDTTWGTEHPYYIKKVINGVDSWEPITVTASMEGEEIPEDEDNIIYEKTSTVTVAETGDYWVVANNRKGKASKDTYSNYVRIPGPEPLSVEVEEGLELDETEDHYMVTLEEDGSFELSAKGSTARLGKAGGAGDKITFVWTKDEEEVKDPSVLTNGSTDVFEHGVVASSNRANFDEVYNVAIKASRNGDDTPIINTKFRVTDKASAPLVAAHNTEIRKRNGETVVLSVDVSVDGMVSDDLTYQWYKIIADEEEQTEPGVNDIAIQDATEPEFETDGDGMFYCLVTNHVNGTVATSPIPNPEVASDRPKYTAITVY